MASSSSIKTNGSNYDVFLSFRGEDTRNNFVDHLYGNLAQKGIRVFKDDEMLGGGKPISRELIKAIEESRIAVVVFSKNYANSSWCLDELAKIMECQDRIGQNVIPVFYHVDPSDVRGQKRDYETAFEEQEKKFGGDMEKLNKWRKALIAAAGLSGHHISASSGGEYATLNKIVQQIRNYIQPRGTENNLIGIESRIDELNSLLEMEAVEEVRIVGIYGMGGIGKTTIARTMFKRISYKFDGTSFVNDVRQNDICILQGQILKNVLGGHHEIQDREDGAELLQERFRKKKVLIVLDDVDDDEQLECLAAKHEWFGPGSRIIITTRDEHLLSNANAKYKPALLSTDQAVELFSKHAFRKNTPDEGYEELSYRAIRYTGNLPLALKVLGCHLRERKAIVWKSALNRVAEEPEEKVYETLKLSFDGLKQSEKMIFLDIACFYKGRIIDGVTSILDSLGSHTEIGINVLIDKSLITVKNLMIHMHDLIQEMGWRIVHTSYPNSRLWLPETIYDCVKKQRELQAIEAIQYLTYNQRNNLYLRADVFESMENLRLLDVNYSFTSCQPTFLPGGLQYLSWENYPFSSLPLANMRNLVQLNLWYGYIEDLWEGKQIMPNLKFIKLFHCRSLKRFPDVSESPNIEMLMLCDCKELVEVDESLGDLKRLVYFSIDDCENLEHLPSKLEMKSLETISLKGCKNLKRLPKFSPCMVKLSKIIFSLCSIEELPLSIIHLFNLSFLDLNGCVSLKNLTECICELRCLKNLHLGNSGSLQKSAVLQLGGTARPAESINFRALTNLCSLRILDLSFRHIKEEDFPTNFHEFSLLEELDLSYNLELIQLPASIYHLSRLKCLQLNYCCALRKLHGLPSGIRELSAKNCYLLETIEDLSKRHGYFYRINLTNCESLQFVLKYEENEDHDLSEEKEEYLESMLDQSLFQKWAAVDGCLSIGIPGSKIPSWFKQQQHGNKIALKLPPNWQTRTLGFAVCGVFGIMLDNDDDVPEIKFKFEKDGMSAQKQIVPISEVGCTNSSTGYENLWMGYIPFSLFQQKDIEYMDDDSDGDDVEYKELPRIIEDNVVIDVSTYKDVAVRCGAYVVYKEDLESFQQIKPPSLSPLKWEWNISYSNLNKHYRAHFFWV